jgi:hypothetical protein
LAFPTCGCDRSIRAASFSSASMVVTASSVLSVPSSSCLRA